MSSPETEILASIRRMQEELNAVLPTEIGLSAGEAAAVQIRVHLLRARLEFSPEQEDAPLPLAQLLAVLFELAGHAEELSGLTVATGTEGSPREALLGAMRAAVLTGEIAGLRAALEEQRHTLASAAASREAGPDIHPA